MTTEITLRKGSAAPAAMLDSKQFENALGGLAYRNASSGLFGGNVGVRLRGTNSATREINRERSQAVANARFVDRNNAMMQRGITKRATNLVGTNLRLRAMPNWKALSRVRSTMDEQWAREFKAAWEEIFSLWGDDDRMLCDAERHLQFGGLMHMAARNAYGADGESFIHIRLDDERREEYGGTFATFLEIVDTDRISTPSRYIERPGAPKIVNGRELDRFGAAVAFHIRDEHPGEGVNQPDWQRVPRESARGRPIGVHWFAKHRAGAQRGMPAILAALRDVKMLEEYDDKRLEAAALAAMTSLVLKTDKSTAEVLQSFNRETPSGGAAELVDDLWDGQWSLYEDLEIRAQDGSRIPILAPGDELQQVSPEFASVNDDSFIYHFGRKMAAVLGIGAPNALGDYSKTSFASIRADFMDTWRENLAERHQVTQATATPCARALMEEALGRRMLPMPRNAPDFYTYANAYAQCEWRGPAMGTIDPVKDPTGAGIAIEGGFSTPQAEAAARGFDYYEVIDERAEAEAYARDKGVTLSYGNRGAQPAAVTAEDDEDEPEQAPRPLPRPQD